MRQVTDMNFDVSKETHNFCASYHTSANTGEYVQMSVLTEAENDEDEEEEKLLSNRATRYLRKMSRSREQF